MLAALSPLISRGVIDNTARDTITLRLWGVDEGEPLEYVMQGNCLPDIAGCCVRFENRACIQPQRGENPVLRRMRAESHKTTLAGDITLSRRVPERDNRRALQNILSLEFFPGTELRVLLESVDYTFDISLPQWRMTEAEAAAQHFFNREAMRAHVALNVVQFCGPGMVEIRDRRFPGSAWDERLNRAEACMAIYPTVQDKYRYDSDRRAAEAYVMGCDTQLGRLAMEDEAQLPPEKPKRTQEVVDFLSPEDAAEVKRAMHHPLFTETSRVTMLVQEQMMKNGQPRGQEAERFVNAYAAAVSHILATLLITRQESYRPELVAQRLAHISRALADMPALLGKERGALLQEALGALISKVDEFAASLQR